MFGRAKKMADRVQSDRSQVDGAEDRLSKMTEPPDEFICPLTLSIMREPVLLHTPVGTLTHDVF